MWAISSVQKRGQTGEKWKKAEEKRSIRRTYRSYVLSSHKTTIILIEQQQLFRLSRDLDFHSNYIDGKRDGKYFFIHVLIM